MNRSGPIDPTDPQQHRVYAAEDAVADEIGPRLRRWTEVEAFLTRVVTSAWYHELFPDGPIDVELQRRSRSATASLALAGADVIAVRDGSWNAITLLHELAHLVAPGEPPHGPRFTATELELVRRVCGIEAFAALRSSFDTHDVEVGGSTT